MSVRVGSSIVTFIIIILLVGAKALFCRGVNGIQEAAAGAIAGS